MHSKRLQLPFSLFSTRQKNWLRVIFRKTELRRQRICSSLQRRSRCTVFGAGFTRMSKECKTSVNSSIWARISSRSLSFALGMLYFTLCSLFNLSCVHLYCSSLHLCINHSKTFNIHIHRHLTINHPSLSHYHNHTHVSTHIHTPHVNHHQPPPHSHASPSPARSRSDPTRVHWEKWW